MRAIWTIARRELKSLFDHPTGYILLVIFIAINNFLFFREIFLEGVATIRPMLGLLPWLFLFFVPAVSMRALAEDNRTGAIEVVLAQPLTEFELLIGKYLGQVLVVWIGLACTLPVPIALSFGGHMAVGELFAQYFGAALLGAGLTGVGVWASSLTRNQITAFIIAVAVTFVLILVGLDPLLVGLPPVPATIAARLGVLSHFRDIGRGVIDLRDVLYFLTLAAIFLALAYGRLMRRKLSPAGAALKRLRTGVVLLVASMVVVDLLGGYIGGRLDLTPGQAYTLSKATKNILGHLGDLVTIQLFVSRKLPPQIALERRDVNDLLSDYRSAGHGKVRVAVVDPASSESAAEQARQLGVQPVQFNVVGQTEESVQQGWFGLAVRYEDKTAAIPLIRRTDDLEYRLTSMIHGFVDPSKKHVALAVASNPSQRSPAFSTLRQQLSRDYTVSDVDLSNPKGQLNGVNVLIIAGEPDSVPAAMRARLAAFFQHGGSALVMARGVQLNSRFPMASAGAPRVLNAVLHPYGLSIRADLVDDLLSNRPVGVPTQLGQMITPYPLWVRGISTRESPVNEEIPSLFLPWTSSIDTAGAKAGTVIPLVVSSRGAGVRTGVVSLNPQQNFPRDSLHRRLLAALINPLHSSKKKKKAAAAAMGSLPRGRVILVADRDFASDRYVRDAPQNLNFALNAVDWLAQDPTLLSIRAKSRTPPPLAFSSPTAQDAAKYANLIGIPLLIILVGIARLWARRQTTRRAYVPMTSGGEA